MTREYTDNGHLPFPTGNSFVIDGDDDIGALAQAVDETWSGGRRSDATAVQIPHAVATAVGGGSTYTVTGEAVISTATGGRLQVTRTGWYFVSASHRFATSAAGTARQLRLMVGSTLLISDARPPGTAPTPAVSTLALLPAGAILSIMLYQDSGADLATLPGLGHPHLAAVLIAPVPDDVATVHGMQPLPEPLEDGELPEQTEQTEVI